MKILRWVLLAFAVLLVLAVGIFLLFNLKLAPSLSFTPPWVSASVTPGDVATEEAAFPVVEITPSDEPPGLPELTAVSTTSVPEEESAATTLPEPTSTAALSAAQSGKCGDTGSMTVLLLGESSPSDVPPRGADAIRLIKVDFDRMLVSVVSLPPDLWVQTPALASNQAGGTTLTLTYYYAKQASQGDERAKMIAATQVLAQTLLDNFGVAPEHYVTMKQSTFVDMIDAMGGLAIQIPATVDGTSSGYGVFNTGLQVLTGQQALDYARLMNNRTDADPSEWDRFDRQDQVIQALFQQIKQPATLLSAPNLIQQFFADVVTDFSLNQMLDMVCVLRDSSTNIQFLDLSADMVHPTGDLILGANVPKISSYLQGIFQQ